MVFRVLEAGNFPSHRALCGFRRRYLKRLFVGGVWTLIQRKTCVLASRCAGTNFPRSCVGAVWTKLFLLLSIQSGA